MIDIAGNDVYCELSNDCDQLAVTFIRDDRRFHPTCENHVPEGVIPTDPEWEVLDNEY